MDSSALRRWRRDVVLAALLLGATFLAYGPALRGELLLDDDVHITSPELRSLSGLARIWTDIGATQQYYPVVHTAFWLEHRLWGDAVLGYHVLNVLLHSIAALLLVAIVRQLKLSGGWLAGFVFALHPVCVESVAWIAEQKNTLSAVFCLGAALVYLRFDERRARRSGTNRESPMDSRGGGERQQAEVCRLAGARRYSPISSLWYYGIASGLFGLALFTKTAVATLPAILLVIMWWRRGRLEWKRDVRPLVPWFLAAMVAGLITIAVERDLITGIEAKVALTWADRLAIAGHSIWFYVGKLLWPANLSFFYERGSSVSDSWGNYGFTAVSFAVLLGLAWFSRRSRGPLAAGLIFVGTLLPVLGLIDVQWFVFSYVADHFQYLACLGIIVPVSAGLARVATQLQPVARTAAVTAAIMLLVLLGALTREHSKTFRDNVSLYANAVRRTPGSAVAHHHLALSLARFSDRLPEAIAAYQAALRINPEAPEVHQNLGIALLTSPGRQRDAFVHLETALQLKPSLVSARRHLAAAHFDLGKALAATPGRLAEAISHYERALRLDPKFAEAHFNLGNALLKDPLRRGEAIASFETALRLKPDFAEAHANLGTAIAAIPGRLQEAAAHFEAALRINPDFAPAQNNLRHVRQLLEEAGVKKP